MHTPGGDPNAADGIVQYLRSKFDDIRIIVPLMAMSAGTMICCSANVIVMAKHSFLGPIDPQMNIGLPMSIPAHNIMEEFAKAKEELINKYNIPGIFEYWRLLLSKYPIPAIFEISNNSLSLSKELVKKWLRTYMFPSKSVSKINNIVKKLSMNPKSHSRHFGYDACKKDIGLNVEPLEGDNALQDLVLSIHHSIMITFEGTPSVKIVCNNLGKAMVSNDPTIAKK